MTIEKDEVRVDIKELIVLIRLDERYAALVNDGVFPVDQEAIQSNHMRRVRIKELSRKYGLAENL